MLPAFHAITGCDTVSRLYGHSKITAFRVFKKNAGLLTWLGRGDLSVDAIKDAETSICNLYSSDDDFTSTDKLRCKLYLSGRCMLENLPPTSDVVELYIKRAHYQTGIWLLSLEQILISRHQSQMDGWNLKVAENGTDKERPCANMWYWITDMQM